MLILTNDNRTFDLNHIGQVLAEPVYYSVFDFSDKTNSDFYFRPLCMTENFNNVSIELQIGQHKLLLPQEWSIVCGDPTIGEMELIPVHEINTREFHVFVKNPIKTDLLPKFLPIKPIDLFTDINWTLPRLGFHNFLLVPLHSGEAPDCVFIINEAEQKKIPQLNLNLFI